MLTQSDIEQTRQAASRQADPGRRRDGFATETRFIDQPRDSAPYSYTQPLNTSSQWSLPSITAPFLEENPPFDNLEDFGPRVSASELDLDFIRDNLNAFDEVDPILAESLTSQSRACAMTNESKPSNVFVNTKQHHELEQPPLHAHLATSARSSMINIPDLAAAAYAHGTQSNNEQHVSTSRALKPLTFAAPGGMTNNQNTFLTARFGVMPQIPNGSGLGVGFNSANPGPSSAYAFGTPSHGSQWPTMQRYQPPIGGLHPGFNNIRKQNIDLLQTPSYSQAPGLIMAQRAGASAIMPQHSSGMMWNPAEANNHVGGNLPTHNPYANATVGQKRKSASDGQSGGASKRARTIAMAATYPSAPVTNAGGPVLPDHAPASDAMSGNQQILVTHDNVSGIQYRPDARNAAAQFWTVNGVEYHVLMRLNNTVRVRRTAATVVVGAHTLVELYTPHNHWTLTQSYNDIYPNDNDETTAAAGQANWTEDRNNGRPDVLFELHPQGVYDYTGNRTRKPQHSYAPLVHSTGKIFLSHDGRPMLASIHLPDMISTKVEGWRITSICREDSNVGYKDFVDRMPIFRGTGSLRRPVTGTLESRCSRDRQRMRIITWPEPVRKSYMDRKVVEDTVRIEGPGSNSTRQLTDLTDVEIEIQKIVTYGDKSERAGSRKLSPTERFVKHEEDMKQLFRYGLDINSEEAGIVAGKLNVLAPLLNRSVDIFAIRRDAVGF